MIDVPLGGVCPWNPTQDGGAHAKESVARCSWNIAENTYLHSKME